jgi:hypothetical protein
LATTPQRAYRAACPNCGAPVEFASAASASAVCSFCKSTLVRDGEALTRIGSAGELFDDHSPLQLGASGIAQGIAFTLVGRLQYGYEGGTWNEWHALFDNGRSAWLSEDNGAYVLAFDGPLPPGAPADLGALRAGQQVHVAGRLWDVASVVRAKLIAAAGELPRPPRADEEFLVADLRNDAGEVATLDASDPKGLAWASGRSVLLTDLRMQGLAQIREKTLGSRGLPCPSCGAALEVTLATTKSVSCRQCNAVVDLASGADAVGGQLAYYAQNNSGEGGLEPQIPLGRSGKLALGTSEALPWQVVGYQERCDIPEDSEDEQTFWREYLLYNREHGFAFLVDAEDGWSWTRPITGAPKVKGEQASYRGANFKKRYAYQAKVTWVQGEFYWRVTRGEKAHVTDYDGTGADSKKRLAREQAGNEVVWSAGATLDAAQVADAFAISPAQRAALQRDATPVSGKTAGTLKTILIVCVILFLVFMLSECDDDRCDGVRQTFGPQSAEYRQCLASSGTRTSGGSRGGWSTGGGHK